MEGYRYVPNEKGVIVPKISDGANPETWGLVQRCARQLVEEVEKVKGARDVTISVSFLEIYNEHIYDLLNSSLFRRRKAPSPTDPQPSTQATASFDPNGLKLKWNNQELYTVENLFTFECQTYAHIMSLFHEGIKNKAIGSHKLNLASSRSHSIFTINLE